jgi:hypothetical protein
MLPYFPKPYPDEILYSVLARYHAHVGNQSPKATIKELFGTTTTRAVIDLQGNLLSLMQRLPLLCSLDLNEIITNHTMLWFYQPFIDEERHRKVKQAMAGNKGGTIHTRLGISASSVPNKGHLYYCLDCFAEDRRSLGETYWRNIHQAPGIFVCPKHKTLLNKGILFKSEINQHHFLQAEDECNFSKPIDDRDINLLDKKILDIFYNISKDVEYFYNGKLQSRPVQFYREKYVNLLKDKGLANSNGRINQIALEEEFKYFYPKELLDILNVNIKINDDASWLRGIVRKHRKTFHPIQHILMMRFLTGSVEQFYNERIDYRPFGNGNWHCLNPAANHYKEKCIDEVEIRYCQDSKKPIGIFKCSCGFIYSRRGPDITAADKYRIGKVIEYGPLWEQFLKEMVLNNEPLNSIAKKLNVDVETIKKKAEKLALKVPWTPPRKRQPRKSTGDENRFQLMRDEWKKAQMKNPELSKTQLREQLKHVYTWLYRNDYDWLQQNSPIIKKPVALKARVDWDKRDEEILLQLKETVQKWNDVEKPIRITKKLLARKINKVSLLEKYAKNLPKSINFIHSVSESVEDFQIRRSNVVINQLKKERILIKDWEVYRKAGLRTTVSDKVKNFIKIELEKVFLEDINENIKNV